MWVFDCITSSFFSFVSLSNNLSAASGNLGLANRHPKKLKIKIKLMARLKRQNLFNCFNCLLILLNELLH